MGKIKTGWLVIGGFVLIMSYTLSMLMTTSRINASAQQSLDTCMSNLNQVHKALSQYKLDTNAYPPHLLSSVIYRPKKQLIPANELKKSFLYPKLLNNLAIFHCPVSSTKPDVTAKAVWPSFMEMETGKPSKRGGKPVTAQNKPSAIELYPYSSYDLAHIPQTGKYELRYTLFWSNNALDGSIANNRVDSIRQLGYRSPDQNTTVTWCSHHRIMEAGKLKDLVLFLDGSAKTVDAELMKKYAWSYQPGK